MKLKSAFGFLTLSPIMASAWLFGSDLVLRDPTTSAFFYPTSTRALIHQRQQQLQNLMNREFFSQAYPRYEIADETDTFKITVEVPGMTQDDVQVSLEDDGKVLSIKGSHEEKEDGHSMSSKFTQRFLLDPSVDVDALTANLKDGVLIVMAPKDVKKLEASVRKIPVTYMQNENALVNVDGGKVDEATENKMEADRVNG
jgi:HSP20 family protein